MPQTTEDLTEGVLSASVSRRLGRRTTASNGTGVDVAHYPVGTPPAPGGAGWSARRANVCR